MDVRAARWRTLRAVVGRLSRRITSACLACLPACGARTGDLSASVVTQNVEAGASSDATLVDAFADSPAPGNDAGCGAPWVVFQINGQDGGLDSTGVIYARRADGTDGHVLSLPHPDPQTPSGLRRQPLPRVHLGQRPRDRPEPRVCAPHRGRMGADESDRLRRRRRESGPLPDPERRRDARRPDADLRASGFPANPTWADACTKLWAWTTERRREPPGSGGQKKEGAPCRSRLPFFVASTKKGEAMKYLTFVGP